MDAPLITSFALSVACIANAIAAGRTTRTILELTKRLVIAEKAIAFLIDARFTGPEDPQ